MSTLTSEQAKELADFFSSMANVIDRYKINNFDNLTDDQKEYFRNMMFDLWDRSDQMYTLSATLVMDELQTSLQKIRDINGRIQNTFNKLSNIQKAIDLSGAVIGLAAALLSKDPGTIGSSIRDLMVKVGD